VGGGGTELYPLDARGRKIMGLEKQFDRSRTVEKASWQVRKNFFWGKGQGEKGGSVWFWHTDRDREQFRKTARKLGKTTERRKIYRQRGEEDSRPPSKQKAATWGGKKKNLGCSNT